MTGADLETNIELLIDYPLKQGLKQVKLDIDIDNLRASY